MRTKGRKRTILLALTSTHHGFYRGAARYAAEHDWHIVADIIYDATIPVGWRGDGILSFVGHWDDLAKYVYFRRSSGCRNLVGPKGLGRSECDGGQRCNRTPHQARIVQKVGSRPTI
jgi:hypothetical protein